MDLVDPISETAQEFKELVRGVMEEAGKPNLVDYFPVLRRIDPQGIRRRLTIYFGRMIEIFDRMIKQRLQLRKIQGSIARSDVLDVLLNISEDNSNEIERSHMEHLLVVSIFYLHLKFLSSSLLHIPAMNLVWFLMIQIAVGQINIIFRPIKTSRDYVTGLICCGD